jgi:hypothetical protein
MHEANHGADGRPNKEKEMSAKEFVKKLYWVLMNSSLEEIKELCRLNNANYQQVLAEIEKTSDLLGGCSLTRANIISGRNGARPRRRVNQRY